MTDSKDSLITEKMVFDATMVLAHRDNIYGEKLAMPLEAVRDALNAVAADFVIEVVKRLQPPKEVLTFGTAKTLGKPWDGPSSAKVEPAPEPAIHTEIRAAMNGIADGFLYIIEMATGVYGNVKVEPAPAEKPKAKKPRFWRVEFGGVKVLRSYRERKGGDLTLVVRVPLSIPDVPDVGDRFVDSHAVYVITKVGGFVRDTEQGFSEFKFDVRPDLQASGNARFGFGGWGA